MSKYSVSTVFKGVDKITKPIAKMQKSIGKFTTKAENGFRRANIAASKISKGMAIGAAGAIAAIGTVTAALNILGGELDNLAKTSRRLDIPIEELQELQFIGEQSGVTTKDMNKALGTFAKRLGEAKRGSGALYSGLDKSNPALLEQLQNTESLSEAFDLYISAIRDLKDPTEQAALASDAFSKSGMKLIQISHNSESAIEQMRKQMEENGLVTQEQAENAEAYNDAQNRLSKTLKGFMTSVLTPLFPIMTDVIDRMREWGIANKDIVASNITEYAQWLLDVLSQYGQYIPLVLKTVGAFLAFNLALKTTVAIMTLLNLVMMANPATLMILGIAAAVAAVVAAVAAIYVAWDPLKDYFSDLFSGIVAIYDDTVGALINAIKKAKSFLGIGDSDIDINNNQTIDAGNVVTPQERISREINESRETYGITVRAEQGSYAYADKYTPKIKLINTAN